jgi:hypothetical protein
MSLFEPTLAEAKKVAMAQQDRAERLAERITQARHAVKRGEGAERILWLLEHDDEMGSE